MNTGNGHHVLFIDDDKHLTRVVKDFLKHEGFSVQTAASAEEGIRALEKKKPDIIVLDISMPGMGGIGFLKRISNGDGSLKYPVLVLTARAVMQDFFDTVAVGGFLAKPCSELDLIREIREILDTAASQPQVVAETTLRKPKRILIGEDDQHMAPLYVNTFKEGGYEVHLATTGPDVLEQSVAIRPDVVVMKEMLPNMSGSVVARLIKTMPKTRGVSIVIHDQTRSDVPPVTSDKSIDTFLVSSMSYDLLEAVRKLASKQSRPGTGIHR